MKRHFNAVVCGAGITGVSAAYFLAKAGIKRILLVDERPPLSFTSDRSTECYRNWWPDPEMLSLMNRSIDIMEQLDHESGNVFRMNSRGYLYVSADESRIEDLISASSRTSAMGAGPFRIHRSDSSGYQPSTADGFDPTLTGADLLIGNELILKHFPYITKDAKAALHVRRAGWLSAQQLGIHLLESGRRLGVQFEADKIVKVHVNGGQVQGIKLASGEEIDCPIFVNAAGPFLKQVGKLLDIHIPVHTELHLKAIIKDAKGVVRRDAPLLIWNDEQFLQWDEEERLALADDSDNRWLTEIFPAGVHTRPEGHGEDILMLWEYHTNVMEPTDDPVMDKQYPEIALRGLSAMLPRMSEYFTKIPRPQLDGGFYTRTRENRPLIGPLGINGAYLIGAVSGYGIMSACGVGELLAAHVMGGSLPEYAPAFSLSRYEDSQYQKRLENWEYDGQL